MKDDLVGVGPLLGGGAMAYGRSPKIVSLAPFPQSAGGGELRFAYNAPFNCSFPQAEFDDEIKRAIWRSPVG